MPYVWSPAHIDDHHPALQTRTRRRRDMSDLPETTQPVRGTPGFLLSLCDPEGSGPGLWLGVTWRLRMGPQGGGAVVDPRGRDPCAGAVL